MSSSQNNHSHYDKEVKDFIRRNPWLCYFFPWQTDDMTLEVAYRSWIDNLNDWIRKNDPKDPPNSEWYTDADQRAAYCRFCYRNGEKRLLTPIGRDSGLVRLQIGNTNKHFANTQKHHGNISQLYNSTKKRYYFGCHSRVYCCSVSENSDSAFWIFWSTRVGKEFFDTRSKATIRDHHIKACQALPEWWHKQTYSPRLTNLARKWLTAMAHSNAVCFYLRKYMVNSWYNLHKLKKQAFCTHSQHPLCTFDMLQNSQRHCWTCCFAPYLSKLQYWCGWRYE